MADSENKTVHFKYKISCINTNVTVIIIIHWIIKYVIIDFVHSHRHDRLQRFYKNMFELDRPNHDSHTKLTELREASRYISKNTKAQSFLIIASALKQFALDNGPSSAGNVFGFLPSSKRYCDLLEIFQNNADLYGRSIILQHS